jgi:hypothetical protein
MIWNQQIKNTATVTDKVDGIYSYLTALKG